MKQKPLWTGIGAFLGMLVLILDGKTALAGGAEGMELCFKTVIPSLFPFFVMSNLLTSALSGVPLPVLRPLGQFCGMPKGMETLLISAFFGGYPVGAQTVAAAYRGGQLSREEAQRLLAFCSNAGPAFLFGMAASLFPRRWMAWALWGIHIVSAVLTSAFLPGKNASGAILPKTKAMSPTEALWQACRVMAAVCGWVVLFRVVIAFLDRWVLWLLPVTARVAVAGFLELSNGCCALASIPNPSLRFLLCSEMLAFGGLCVTMQTVSVTQGLSLRSYIWGKLLQTALSLLLAGAVIGGVWAKSTAFLLLLAGISRRIRKNSSNPAAAGV